MMEFSPSFRKRRAPKKRKDETSTGRAKRCFKGKPLKNYWAARSRETTEGGGIPLRRRGGKTHQSRGWKRREREGKEKRKTSWEDEKRDEKEFSAACCFKRGVFRNSLQIKRRLSADKWSRANTKREENPR